MKSAPDTAKAAALLMPSGTLADLYATWQGLDGKTHVLAGDQVLTLIP